MYKKNKMSNYFFSLPLDLQNYINYINLSIEAIEKIKQFYKRDKINKRDLIYRLINDLKIRNDSIKYKNPMTKPMLNTNIFGDLTYIFPKEIDDISPHDPYTKIVLKLINKLIIGNELFGEDSLISIKLWNRFLWGLAIALWNGEYDSNMGHNDFDINLELYYKLRLKTAEYALQYNIKILNYLPSLSLLDFVSIDNFN